MVVKGIANHPRAFRRTTLAFLMAVLGALVVWAWGVSRTSDEGAARQQTYMTVAGLCLATAALAITLPAFYEWVHRRFRTPKVSLRVEWTNDPEKVALPADTIHREDAVENMASVHVSPSDKSLFVRVVVNCADRYPLDSAIVNVSVPARATIHPHPEPNDRFYLNPLVTPWGADGSKGPFGHDGVRYTVALDTIIPGVDHCYTVLIQPKWEVEDTLLVGINFHADPQPSDDCTLRFVKFTCRPPEQPALSGAG